MSSFSIFFSFVRFDDDVGWLGLMPHYQRVKIYLWMGPRQPGASGVLPLAFAGIANQLQIRFMGVACA